MFLLGVCALLRRRYEIIVSFAVGGKIIVLGIIFVGTWCCTTFQERPTVILYTVQFASGLTHFPEAKYYKGPLYNIIQLMTVV